MEKQAIHEELSTILRSNRLACISRDGLDENSLDGFIIALSEDLCLIEYFCDFFVDGYRVIRLEDISALKSGQVEGVFTDAAVTLGYAELGGTKPPLKIDLANWESVLSGLKRIDMHVALSEEKEHPDSMQVGQIVEVNKESTTLNTYTTTGEWDESFTIRLADLTMIQFGCRYLHAFQNYIALPNND